MQALTVPSPFASKLPAPKPRPRTLVLWDQDLLALVCSNILPDDPVALPKAELLAGRKQLRNVALTCKAFKDPALDRLWICLDSLLPLIKVLPNLKVLHGQYYFSGSLPQECQFRRYSRKLRTLTIGSEAGTSSTHIISPSLFHLITQELGGEILFPNLRYVTTHPTADDADITNFTAQLPWAFSSSVEAATFCGRGISRPLFSEFCFPLAQRQLSGLRHLSLKSSETAPSTSVLEAIMGMNTLESLELHLPGLNSPLESIISKRTGVVLQNLRSLSLDLHCASVVPVPRLLPSNDDVSKTIFPGLTDLRVVSCSGENVCACIPPFMINKLTSLTLTLSTDITSQDHFRKLATGLGHAPSLKSLTLSERPGRNLSVKGVNALGPLLGLPIGELHVNLSSISWGFGSVSGLLMSVQLAHFLKPLSIRSISFPPSTDAGPFILSYLSDVAIQLPMLERLSMGIYSRPQVKVGLLTSGTFPEISGLLHHWKTYHGPPQSRLRHLTIYEQKPLTEFNAGQYNDLAQLLDLMFPQLISIEPYTEADRTAPYWKNHWWFIEHLRKMYRRLRLLEDAVLM